MRFSQTFTGRADLSRPWAHSHAGRALASWSFPAAVIETSRSRRSFPSRTATQPRSASGGSAGQRRFVEHGQRPEIPLTQLARTVQQAQQRILGRPQANATQLLVVKPADGSRSPSQVVAKARSAGRGRFRTTHISCIHIQYADVKGGQKKASWKPGRQSPPKPKPS